MRRQQDRAPKIPPTIGEGRSFILLGDAHSGKVLVVVLWVSEEAMRASEEATDRMRGLAAHATGAQIADVERYEVRVFEVSS